ncbi:type II/IV secretion system ATPase [Thermococcus onnurineus NA1]|uniref:Type II/IV secretion system ATPase n=1 Tax=Thermococcus onnurineus (strain NA1) TaxID=523850 RepID=B6YUI0_THEON|nr:CpaF family protein [Thermococcus onnurineus]ACJ17165.1 type II/IV secretion system ATPase [Thermococcus onnurineus NA1]NJE46104.1 CpaF family protein [Thermococcus sp. GR7]NJE78260.1 CpaF family protein [Thermococcus sp. GR4]NJF22301.1 CpaF family protein [Thermococcus sp. GR5]
MLDGKKKKKEGLSWIDEILNGEDDLLESMLRDEKKKEKEESLPFVDRKGGIDLDEILSKPSSEDTLNSRPTGADILGEILTKDTLEKKPTPVEKPKPKPPSTLQDILGSSASKEETTYAGRAEVLDAYGNVRILKVKGEPVPIYEIRLPKLTRDEEELFRRIKERAITELQIDPTAFPDPEERRRVFMNAIRKMIKEDAPHFSEGRIEILTEMIVQSMIGYGKLDPLVRDDNLEEIMVIGTKRPVYVWHRRFNMCKTNIIFPEDREILNIIERIAREVGRRIDQQSPLLDARLPDGSRVNATIPPISLDGPTITIRKFKKDPLTIIDLIKYGTMSTDIASLLWIFVDGLGVKPANVLVAGGTGSGKTTTLNAIGMFIPPSERVITIEDTAELQLPVEHWVRLETRPPNLEGKGEITMDDLVKNTLRMRPDRIIVGEVRGPEARTMFTAMNTGHDGCMGTIHANSARETIVRLESPPMNVPKIMIPALDIIIMQVRFHSRKKGTIRRITEIAEISGVEGENIQLNKLYKYDPAKDELVPTGVPSKTLNALAHHTGMSMAELELEKEKRKIILDWMVEQGIRGIEKVGYYIRQFYVDEEALFKKIEAESDVETSRQIRNLI